MLKLQGLVSLITGGASGLGKETVKHLARQGGSVMLIDLPESKGQEISKSIGEKVIFAPCDVSSEKDVSNALSLCKEKFGRLDLVVNCAGLSRAFKIANPPSGNVMQLEEFDVVYKSNAIGTFNVIRLATPLIAQNEPTSENQERGLIINTGSLSSEDGCIGQSAFAAAKGAIEAMTLPIARDLSSLGIRIVTISPGLFDTPLTDEVCLTKVVQNYFIEQILFPKRFGKPSEFAQMVENVVLNPMLNGVNIKLNGGLRFHVDVKVPLGVPLQLKAKKS